jgi:hypothetical protein
VYIEYLDKQMLFGACKIVPPANWRAETDVEMKWKSEKIRPEKQYVIIFNLLFIFHRILSGKNGIYYYTNVIDKGTDGLEFQHLCQQTIPKSHSMSNTTIFHFFHNYRYFRHGN